mmetsp:Transcript_14642/g.35337  ORF Transcript_14642/g.35337 Transcript_14642/m.35337 type:complete len:285 (+) Transcript_14642:54-908(+)
MSLRTQKEQVAVAAAAEVARLVHSSDVVMFSRTTCPYCRDAKTLLQRELGVAFSAVKVIELDQDPSTSAARAHALVALSGLSTVPNTFIAGEHVGSYEDLAKLRGTGKLRPMFRAAGILPVEKGDRIPSATVRVVSKDAAAGQEQDTMALFKGKTAVLFGVPAAFSPSCSERHLPGFVANAEAFKAQGVDLIACVSVNDAFVMKAWATKLDALGSPVVLLADGNATFIRSLGLIQDASKGGMGMRSRRFAAVIRDGVVEHIEVDQPGQTDVSTAENMLPRVARL